MNHLSTSADAFIRYCRFEKNLSKKTLAAYKIDITQFLCFLQGKGYDKSSSLVTKHELREYLESISHFKVKTIKRKIATLKALFNFLEFEDQIPISPFRKMRIQIKEARSLPTVMSVTEITKLLKVLYKNKEKLSLRQSYRYEEAIRNIAVIELLFTTGARVSEIANLLSRCVDLQTGTILIKGKGDKERTLHVYNTETLSILNQYQQLTISKLDIPPKHFFINRLRKKLSDQSIRNLVKKISRSAGIHKKITPHVFRHSFATLLLENDVDIKYIQSLLGHSSITTTQIYTHVNRVKQKQILKKKHPRKDLIMIKQ